MTKKRPKPSFAQVIKSVISALFGIQSDENRQRDFEYGKASDYIIVGLITVVILVIGMAILVNILIKMTS